MSIKPQVTYDVQKEQFRRSDDGYEGTRVYQVIARSQLDALMILGRMGVRDGSIYQSAWGEIPDRTIICRYLDVVSPKRPAPIGGDGLYHITAHFSQKGARAPQPVIGGPPVYTWRTSFYQTTIDTDIDGNRITNTAGQTVRVPFEEVMASLQVRWYVTSYQPPMLIRTQNSVNAKVWQEAQPGQAKCQGLAPEQQSENLYLMTANFDFRQIGWQPKFINEGLQEIIPDPQAAQGEPPVYGADGKVGASWPSPVPLDANGRRLATGSPIIRTANVYRTMDFNRELGI